MDVLIAGAGVGGLALAAGLLADGHQVRVLEQASGLRRGGAAVTVFSNGAAAMARLGLPLGDFGSPIDLLDFRIADGRRFACADLRVVRRRTGFPVVTTPRERLVAHLAAGLPEGVVRFDRGVESVTVAPDGVVATDSRGDVHRAEVLVGADGYRSAVRRSILDGAPAAKVGWTTWQGLTEVLPDVARRTVGWGYVGRAGMCGIMPAGDGLVQWWFDVRDPGPGEDADNVTGWLRRRFADYVEPVPTLLESISDADIGRYPHVVHRVPRRWGTGPTTLLGDAAHAFPPSQAQGANQTLEDAWMITRVLRTSGDPAAALRDYERRRLRRVRLVSRLAAAEGTIDPPATLVRLTRHAPPALMGRLYTAQLRRFSNVLREPDTSG